MKTLMMTILVGAASLTFPMMSQAASMNLSPCDDGYKVFEIGVCVKNDMDFGADYKKAIGIIKKNVSDQHGILDFVHIGKLLQLPGNGNFTASTHTKDKDIKILMHNWEVTQSLVSDRKN